MILGKNALRNSQYSKAREGEFNSKIISHINLYISLTVFSTEQNLYALFSIRTHIFWFQNKPRRKKRVENVEQKALFTVLLAIGTYFQLFNIK